MRMDRFTLFRTHFRFVLRTRAWALFGVVAACTLATPPVAAVETAAAPKCRPERTLARIPQLPEASGIAASRRVPGRLWAINDSGEPLIYMLEASGKVTGKVRLTKATVNDWEAIAVGPCASGSCLYIADIGDNDGDRRGVSIYRVTEPEESPAAEVAAEVLHVSYPDGPQDAEALVVTPDGRLSIITKGDTGTIAIYRLPPAVKSDAPVVLERVGTIRDGPVSADDRITDAAASGDGQWTALRTKRKLSLFRTAELMSANWRPVAVVDLAPLREPQGEGVAFAPDNTLYVAGEGGGESEPGTLGRVTCTWPR
jgi:hypothetical protein